MKDSIEHRLEWLTKKENRGALSPSELTAITSYQNALIGKQVLRENAINSINKIFERVHG